MASLPSANFQPSTFHYHAAAVAAAASCHGIPLTANCQGEFILVRRAEFSSSVPSETVSTTSSFRKPLVLPRCSGAAISTETGRGNIVRFDIELTEGVSFARIIFVDTMTSVIG
ncbi:uncharacterized protein LOC125499695 [Athalia rosae]|uniref:uncharacterized protein LOC125499695 n=1 Tax=Athalia rosae TaxID=37344 RepID=UPI0020343885|nr:uncharacterized protein LOC125499695 [Athalia rosae]